MQGLPTKTAEIYITEGITDIIEHAVPQMDEKPCALLAKGKTKKAVKEMTRFTTTQAENIFSQWVELDKTYGPIICVNFLLIT